MTAAKRGPGRPPLDNPRNRVIRVRMTMDEEAELTRAWERWMLQGHGNNWSEWVRDTLLRRARRDNRKAKQ